MHRYVGFGVRILAYLGLVQFLQSFANKHISSSEDRLEETKRKKLSIKCQKLVELMMVSGVPTSSGYEERIRFSEMEVVESGAIEAGVLHTLPEGHYHNGWDVNVAGVRTTSVKRNIRYHKHAEFILRVKRKGELEFFVGRRYGDFSRLHKRLRRELPGKVLPPMPRKNKQSSTASNLLSGITGGADSDGSSLSSVSTMDTVQAAKNGLGKLSVRGMLFLRTVFENLLIALQIIVEIRPLVLEQIHPAIR